MASSQCRRPVSGSDSSTALYSRRHLQPAEAPQTNRPAPDRAPVHGRPRPRGFVWRQIGCAAGVDKASMTARGSAHSVFDDVLAAIAPIVGLENVQSTGRVTELLIGNGSVITEYLADLLVQARTEVLFSTCFWASSTSLSLLHDALLALNGRTRRESRRVTVKIMFSSYSFRQKFLSFRGTRIWKPSTWQQLGLPPPEMLDALDMTVVSRFKKPFGVMHAKFLIIDRSSVILPSSNISCISTTYL